MRYLLLIFVALQLVSCDPRMVKPTAFVTLKATIFPNANLRLGDTLKLSVILGDSLEYFDTAGKSSKIYVNSLQEASYGFACYKFDTLNGGVYSYSINYDFVGIFARKGKIRLGVKAPAGDGYLSIQQKPYTSELHFIPKEKGVYFIELRYQPVNIKINDNFEARLSVVFDERVNKNMDIYCRYSSPRDPNVPLPDLSNCIQGMNATQRFYCFKVE